MYPKKEHPSEKVQLHPRNKHRARYNFAELIRVSPDLAKFVMANAYGDESIDFFNPQAVKTLNQALLKTYYSLNYWDIPEGYLCPPIPGRADYIHYLADLLADGSAQIPQGAQIRCLDIGVGANCVYPILGTQEYGWSFVGSEIDAAALESAQKIVMENAVLENKVALRLQENPKNIFWGIIQKEEKFDVVLCNPPFHSSRKEAQEANIRKVSNLKPGKRITKAELNFGGKGNELWCEGGEEKFVQDMIRQSKLFADSCLWFSTLVSKQSLLESFISTLQKTGAKGIRTVQMGQGNKISRLLAWTFQSPEKQAAWKKSWI